jgi:hypothetical protein
MAPVKDGEGPKGFISLLTHKMPEDTEFHEVPKRTGLLVGMHIIDKFMQLGSLVGLATSPISLYRNSGGRSFFQMMARNCGRGFTLGLPIGLIAVIAKSQSMDSNGLDERAYRLVNNLGQLRTDRFFSIGTAVGALAGFFLSSRWGPYRISLLGGAGIGSALGLLAHVVTSSSSTKVSPSQVVDMVTE